MSHVKITDFKIYTYDLPYLMGKRRKGLIVSVHDDRGREGYGEIAPLEGRSNETLEDAINYTQLFREKLLEGRLKPINFPASVMFGIESALAPLQSNEDQAIVFDHYDLHFPLMSDAKVLQQSPKLKLGSLSVGAAVEETKHVLNFVSPVRIDLNKQWDLYDTLEFVKHFTPEEILYIEEPVKLYTDLETFYERSNIPFAIDEHLAYQPMEKIARLKGLGFVILKPTILGGYTPCKTLMEEAPDLRYVLSSAFETSVGLANIIHLAYRLGIDEPMGLGTHRFFEDDLLDIGPVLAEKKLQASFLQKMPIDKEKLTEV